jgi:DNA invertase Pin-like site-specific DNA recombinase
MTEALRVIIAARLSQKLKKKERESGKGRRDGLGLETQDEYAQEWARGQGMTVVETLADTKSGTVAPWDRKNLKPWVTEPAKMATYDAVLAYSMDRLSRGRQVDFTRIEQWALDNRKVLIVMEEDTRYPSRNDREVAEWDAAKRHARKELEKIAERSDRTQRALLDAGSFVGCPPFGMTTTGAEYAKRLELTEDGRRLMPEVFRMTWQDRAANAAVARWLSDETGREWYPQSVAPLIRNRAYAGHHLHSLPARFGRPAQTWDIPCEAVVDSETWERANRELDRRSEITRTTGRKSGGGQAKTLLAGVARCPVCAATDNPMYRMPRPGRAPVYYCQKRGRARKRAGCGNTVPAPAAEALMDQFMRGNDAEIMTVTRKPPTDYDSAVRDAKNARRSLDQDAPDYDERHAEATAAVRAAEAERDAHAGETETIETAGSGVTYAQRWAGLDEAGRGAWLRKSGVRAYFARDLTEAGAVLTASGAPWAKVSGDDERQRLGFDWIRIDGIPGWAKVLRDAATGVGMLVVWGLDF